MKLLKCLFVLCFIFCIGVKAQTVPVYNQTVTMKPFDNYPNIFSMAPGDPTGVQDFIYGYYYTCYNRTATYLYYWVSGNVAYGVVSVTVGGNYYQFNYPLYYRDPNSGVYTYFLQ